MRTITVPLPGFKYIELPRYSSLQRDLLTPYPVLDRPTFEEIRSLGFAERPLGPLIALDVPARNICAIRTGAFRPPQAGEWYLSGAEVAAYRAPNDLKTSYHIARLVRYDVKLEAKIQITEPGETLMSCPDGGDEHGSV